MLGNGVSNFVRGVPLTSCLIFSQHVESSENHYLHTSRFDLVGISASFSSHWWHLAHEVFTYKEENTAKLILGWFGMCTFCVFFFLNSNGSFGLF